MTLTSFYAMYGIDVQTALFNYGRVRRRFYAAEDDARNTTVVRVFLYLS